MLDVVIIGGGPAGLAAAVYFARQKISFVVLTKNIGGQALLSTDVENYLGFHLLDGVKLVQQFKKHLADYQQAFALKEDEEVERVEKIQGGFRVVSTSGSFETKTILLACGATHRTLGIPGERELYGHGVSYCAACDAPLFKHKTLFIIGGGNSAMDAALLAEKYASEVHLVTVNAALQGDSVMKSKVTESLNIRIHVNKKTTRINGDTLVKSIELVDEKGESQVCATDGVIIEIGVQANSACVPFVGKDRGGQIMIDKFNATNVEGIWAAGDVTDIPQKQIAVAVGEGSKASLSIINYLQTHH